MHVENLLLTVWREKVVVYKFARKGRGMGSSGEVERKIQPQDLVAGPKKCGSVRPIMLTDSTRSIATVDKQEESNFVDCVDCAGKQVQALVVQWHRNC